jgi:hypothetical protein
MGILAGYSKSLSRKAAARSHYDPAKPARSLFKDGG